MSASCLSHTADDLLFRKEIDFCTFWVICCLADLFGRGLNSIQFEPFELSHKCMNIYDEYINIAKLIIHTSYSTFTANVISWQTFNK